MVRIRRGNTLLIKGILISGIAIVSPIIPAHAREISQALNSTAYTVGKVPMEIATVNFKGGDKSNLAMMNSYDNSLSIQLPHFNNLNRSAQPLLKASSGSAAILRSSSYADTSLKQTNNGGGNPVQPTSNSALASPTATPQSAPADAPATIPQPAPAGVLTSPTTTPQSTPADALASPATTPQSTPAGTLASPTATLQSAPAGALASPTTTPQSTPAGTLASPTASSQRTFDSDNAGPTVGINQQHDGKGGVNAVQQQQSTTDQNSDVITLTSGALSAAITWGENAAAQSNLRSMAATITYGDMVTNNTNYQVTIDWGDGGQTGEMLVEPHLNQSLQLSGQHIYHQSGSYVVKVTVSDSQGNQIVTSSSRMSIVI